MTIKQLFKNIANEIRSKSGTTDPIKATDFPQKIREIPVTGGRSSDCTATKSQVLEGCTAVTSDSNDQAAAGTMPNNGSMDEYVGYGDVFSIPEGYHDGSGSVSCSVQGTEGGTFTVDPDDPGADVEVFPEHKYSTSAVKVAGITFENLEAANIVSGVTVTVKANAPSALNPKTLKSVTGTAAALTSGSGTASSFVQNLSISPTYKDNGNTGAGSFLYYEIDLGFEPTLIHGQFGNNGTIFWCSGMTYVVISGGVNGNAKYLEFMYYDQSNPSKSLYDPSTNKIKIPHHAFFGTSAVAVSLNWYRW